MNKLNLLLAAIIITSSGILYAQSDNTKTFEVKSPSGSIKADILIGQSIDYSVSIKGYAFIKNSPISMELMNGLILGKNAELKKLKENSVSEVIKPVVQQKSAEIKDEYNELQMEFSDGYSLIFRAYDDGIAYRWITEFQDSIIVKSEQAGFYFDKDYEIWFPKEESLLTHQERKYKYMNLSEVSADSFCSTGTLLNLENVVKVYISEADLESYPGMYLQGSAEIKNALVGKFAGYPLKTQQVDDRTVKVNEYADYIARTAGRRSFPWRVMIITTEDKQLLTSQMIYKLASPCRIEDPSWIKPGKVAWDWWNDNNIYGVGFKSGINTQTYKYYIDFASEFGIEYIVLDEGWYHLDNVLHVKDQVDVKQIIEYGKQKNVGVILWVTWKALDDQLAKALDAFADWGAKGIKVDFMQRDDQWMVDYYYRVAEAAAQRHLLVDYHGAYKPTGWLRTYPNVITSEGVQGMEHCKWSADSDPEHNLTLPFIRMVAGPMDYTPGAMKNATKADFRDIFSSPMSLGTRCHQLGMYVVYESPLQMLADNPSNYYREPECMQFLSEVPSVWDQTVVQQAKVGDYVITARRKGNVWYIGGMTDWSPRILDIKLDFLDAGEYTMQIWKDGINADRYGSDYVYEEIPVDKETEMEVRMAPGGGFAAIIKAK
ncbi:MAG: glycoside hydrolase family 97 protein [Bacteroidales bacterium]|nr:glycoside hydrolase family 97 protein [Bacteroidales bacterium]MBN2817513.1 glycoside hydrolase family 97 protein [Bacteroidales bacterium]